MHSKTVLGAVLAASLMSFGTAAHAQYVVSIAPPPPQYEVVPGARPGYVWAPGHHAWRNGNYAWVPGRWETARNGYDYREHRWVQRGNGEWVLVGGNWERRGPNGDQDRDGIRNKDDRDRDGDGIANRYDNNRNNTNRMGANGDLDRDGIRNKTDNDRDGDGIRNNRDRYPDDRRRS